MQTDLIVTDEGDYDGDTLASTQPAAATPPISSICSSQSQNTTCSSTQKPLHSKVAKLLAQDLPQSSALTTYDHLCCQLRGARAGGGSVTCEEMVNFKKTERDLKAQVKAVYFDLKGKERAAGSKEHTVYHICKALLFDQWQEIL